VHWLRMPLPFALDHINLCCSRMARAGHSSTAASADDATSSAVGAHLRRSRRGRTGQAPVVTHHHPDHAGLAAWLTERTGAEFWMRRRSNFAAHRDARRERGFGFDQRGGDVRAQWTLRRKARADESNAAPNYRSRVPGFPPHTGA